MVELNEGQKEAYELSKSCRRLYITGKAGVGKTKLAQTIASDFKEKDVVVIAPTNAAVKNIKESMNMKCDFLTVHKFLQLKPVNSDNDEISSAKEIDLSLRFEKIENNNENKRSYKIVIIDEVGMIGSELMTEIDNKCKEMKAKVIALGDHLQLLPVGDDQADLESMGFKKYKLTEQMRQDNIDSALYRTINMFADCIEDGSIEVGSLELVNSDDSLIERDTLIDAFFEGEIDVIGCFTNNTVDAYNEVLHELTTGKKRIKTGDEVILYQPIFIKEKDAVINVANNGDTVTVVHDYVDEYGEKRYSLENNENVAYGLLKAKDGKEAAWNTFIKYKGTNEEWIRLRTGRNVDREIMSWRSFKKKWINFKLPYSRTTHKLQGQSFNSVGVNITDISLSLKFDKDMYNRLVYTALSRAKKRCIIC